MQVSLTGLVPSEGSEEAPVPGSLLGNFWWFAGNLRCSQDWERVISMSAFIITWRSACVHACCKFPLFY